MLSSEQRIEKYSIPEPNSGCWLWIGASLPNGYGVSSKNSKSILAHRLSYEVYTGAIPNGMHLDHICRNRCCVNPQHLEPVTPAENLRRGIGQRPKDVCRRGHPMTPDNIVFDSIDKKVRRCAICSRMKNNAGYARKKNA